MDGLDAQAFCSFDVHCIIVEEKCLLRDELIFFQYLFKDIRVGLSFAHAMRIVRLVKEAVERLLRSGLGQDGLVDMVQVYAIRIAEQVNLKLPFQPGQQIELDHGYSAQHGVPAAVDGVVVVI